MSREVDGVDQVRHAVREEIKLGATWIKLMASGSRQEGLTRLGSVWTQSFPEFTMEEMRVAVEEAHSVNRKITAHATEAQAIRNCLEAGFDCVEHTGPLDDELIAMMVERGVWMVPTLCCSYLQAERGAEVGMPAEAIEKRRKSIAESNKGDLISRAAKAGVKMAMGTDAGSPAVPNSEVVREIELLYELGACDSPLEAIAMSTRNGAELLGVLDEWGTLETGKLADVLVVNGDPLEDLAVLRNVHRVYMGGELMVKDGMFTR
jgi:imidazolonepropionase-like amidohydrolase